MPRPPKNDAPVIDVDLVTALEHSLTLLKNTIQSQNPLLDGALVNHDDKDINSVVKKIVVAVNALTDSIAGVKKSQEVLDEKLRVQEDEVDELRQRGLKGNFIITSYPNHTKGKPSLIRTEQQLKEDNVSVTQHVISLAKDKYGVDLPESDIMACHHLPNGTLILRVWNRRPGSAWEKIVDGIKTGVNSEFNVYFNFHLTNHRSALLYKIRCLKKEGKISKFFSDENGHIKVRLSEKGAKHRITYFKSSPKDLPRTLRESEILDFIAKSA